MNSEFYKNLLAYFELDQDELLEASQEISYAGAGDWGISSANIAGELNESNVNETHDGKSMLSLVLGIMETAGEPHHGSKQKYYEPRWDMWEPLLDELIEAGANPIGHDLGFLSSSDLRYWGLHRAAAENREKIGAELISRGSNVNESLIFDMSWVTTPLNLAAEYDSLEFGQMILGRTGTDVNLKDGRGNSPLHHATEIWLGQIKFYGRFINLLLEHHADVQVFNKFLITPLHNVARVCKHMDTSIIDPVELMQTMINRGADVNAVTEKGLSPLHYAVQDGREPKKPDSKVVSVLIENGGIVNAADNDGRTPLHMACKSGWIEAVNCLLDSDANPNAESSDLFATPLKIATDGNRNPNIQLAKILLSRGANPIGVDLSGIG